MRRSLLSGILILTALSIYNCKKEDIYERPGWLAGKLYSQILAQPELSEFAKCIEIAGFDSIINVSGSYTVFAPNNEAFEVYFQENPEYNSVEDIPADILKRIVEFHIVQNPWSTEQLKQLDIYGWIDSTDLENDEPRGFKRETLLLDPNKKYGVKNSIDPVKVGDPRKLIIVDTLSSNWHRLQVTDSRKYAPLFFKEYFDIYDLALTDYDFYFNRSFDPTNMYFVNGQIIKSDIFAENGFIHIIDRVAEPMLNAYQLLKETENGNNYSDFLNLINTFTEFNYNAEKTRAQPGYELGYEVDSLFDISYPDLAFSILNEKTIAPKGTTGLPSEVTIRYQHGLVAPTNNALSAFVNEYFTGPTKWGSLEKAPVHVRRMIVNTHMASGAIYPSLFTKGYHNGESDVITINPSTILEQKFGSNCSFIGVNEVIVPRAFTAVTGPVYLLKGYSTVMYAMEASGLLSALKRDNRDYMFFVENDINLKLDSSLMYDPLKERFAIYQTFKGGATAVSSRVTDLRNLIMNQVGLRQSTGIPRKEFIETLGGNYIIVDNETGIYSGSAPTTFGYQNSEIVDLVPNLISTADNGKTFNVTNWFNFTNADLYNTISLLYPSFHNLLVSAGLADTKNYRYTFTSDNEFYTVFVPSSDALSEYPVSSLTPDQLKKFLRMHFIQGSLIFTDGYKNSGYYETCRIDEKSTTYTTVFTKVFIDPEIDAIEFRDKNGSNFLTVEEAGDITNIMTTRLLVSEIDNVALSYPTKLTNGVIHEIDKVFEFSQMDTE